MRQAWREAFDFVPLTWLAFYRIRDRFWKKKKKKLFQWLMHWNLDLLGSQWMKKMRWESLWHLWTVKKKKKKVHTTCISGAIHTENVTMTSNAETEIETVLSTSVTWSSGGQPRASIAILWDDAWLKYMKDKKKLWSAYLPLALYMNMWARG